MGLAVPSGFFNGNTGRGLVSSLDGGLANLFGKGSFFSPSKGLATDPDDGPAKKLIRDALSLFGRNDFFSPSFSSSLEDFASGLSGKGGLNLFGGGFTSPFPSKGLATDPDDGLAKKLIRDALNLFGNDFFSPSFPSSLAILEEFAAGLSGKGGLVSSLDGGLANLFGKGSFFSPSKGLATDPDDPAKKLIRDALSLFGRNDFFSPSYPPSLSTLEDFASGWGDKGGLVSSLDDGLANLFGGGFTSPFPSKGLATDPDDGPAKKLIRDALSLFGRNDFFSPSFPSSLEEEFAAGLSGKSLRGGLNPFGGGFTSPFPSKGLATDPDDGRAKKLSGAPVAGEGIFGEGVFGGGLFGGGIFGEGVFGGGIFGGGIFGGGIFGGGIFEEGIFGEGVFGGGIFGEGIFGEGVFGGGLFGGGLFTSPFFFRAGSELG